VQTIGLNFLQTKENYMGKMSDLAIELEEKELNLEEFQQHLKDLNDAVVNFKPPKPTRQTRAKTSSKKAKNISGWRRGLELGGSLK
jgi:soluble lytic murein transglycosylase-like protein